MTTESKLVPVPLLRDIEMTWREASAFSNTANNLIERGLPELRGLLAAAAIEHQGPVEVLGYRYDTDGDLTKFSPILKAEAVDEAGREDWTETELVDRAHVTRLQEELAQLRRWEQMIRENSPLVQRLTAAEQRNAELIGLLTRTLAYYTESCFPEDLLVEVKIAIGTLKPTESGASDQCVSDGGTCGLGGQCAECPHKES